MDDTSTTGPSDQMIVAATGDGTPTTTSLIIAEGTHNEHRSVLQLIRNNIADFEEFGPSAFEMRKSGGRPTQVAILNEEQAALLMTYMRNSPVVRDFKKKLVRAFFELRKHLAAPVVDAASLTRMELLQIAMNAESERLALESTNRELAPKADAYDEFIGATGKFGIGVVAKMLGTSQNKLFRDLRNLGVLISKGAMRNTPYQAYMHHFEVKAHEYERSNGELGCSYTTYVQPSGIDFIRRKLGLNSIDPSPTSMDGER